MPDYLQDNLSPSEAKKYNDDYDKINHVSEHFYDLNDDEKRSISSWYIAFSSNQIKSATGNTGAFSSDNNDIRFSNLPDLAVWIVRYRDGNY